MFLADKKLAAVGIDVHYGSINYDQITDHYLTIVASGTELDGRHFFRFYDNANKEEYSKLDFIFITVSALRNYSL